jgi:hypothetical protein
MPVYRYCAWFREANVKLGLEAKYVLGRKLFQSKKPRTCVRGFAFLAPRPGLEPGTYGLTVRRSTD